MESENDTMTVGVGEDTPAYSPEEADRKLRPTLDEVERDLICEALRNTRGNKAKAARALGITERMMGLRVVKYKIDPRAYRTHR